MSPEIAGRRRSLAAAAGALVVLGASALAFLALRRDVRRETHPAGRSGQSEQELAFRPLPRASAPLEVSADGAVLGAALVDGELWLAGGDGLRGAGRRIGLPDGLPSQRVAAVAPWGAGAAFALAAGGWGRLDATGPTEAVSGFGALAVRALVPTESGELLLAAREGLFRADPGGAALARLSGLPARALALLPAGEVAAGGEEGLVVVPPGAGATRRVGTPDPWVESLGFDGRRVWAATPLGVALGSVDGERPELALHPRGGDCTSGVLWSSRWHAVSEGRLVVLSADGGRSEQPLPFAAERLLVAGGLLLADGPEGTWRRGPHGWDVVERRGRDALPSARVNALAADGSRLWIGFFDGGVAWAEPPPGGGAPAAVTALPQSAAWGVNALLPAGGSLWVASLRGAYRLRGTALSPIEGTGAAFSLAAFGGGVAVGYGQGVALPGPRLLSAFHGLPGNQSVALAASRGGEALWVGTPTGLGRVERRRVTGRVTAGEGKLPHPWVTGLAVADDSLLVGTYGGGVAERSGEGSAERWRRFPETEGLKVNASCLVVDAEGRAWIGTQGRGLWRSDPARRRFDRVDAALPSPNVFALALFPAERPRSLFVGTDEGLARLPLPDHPAASETR